MPVDDARRDAMLRAAANTWGEEAAATLADYLEPDGERLANHADIRAIMASIDAMDARFEERFARMDARFEERFVQMDARLDRVEERMEAGFARVDDRFALVDQRFAQVDERFARVDERMGDMETRIDLKMTTMGAELAAQFERGISSAITQQTKTLVFSQLGALVVFAGIILGSG